LIRFAASLLAEDQDGSLSAGEVRRLPETGLTWRPLKFSAVACAQGSEAQHSARHVHSRAPRQPGSSSAPARRAFPRWRCVNL